MKRIIYILPLLQFCFTSIAQPPYPTTPPAPSNITRIEYFIRRFGGTEPGFGNGIALVNPAQQNINAYTESINLGSLPQGFYQVFIRSLDADGKWSITNASSPFSYIVTPIYPTSPPTNSNIVRLEYAIDANLPFGSGTAIPITPAINIANLNAVIDISNLPAGPHILFIRSLDANGKWSITNIAFFSNAAVPAYPTAPSAANPIQQMEYFIDTDPGFGLATPVTFSNSIDVTSSFSVASLPSGSYNFYIRSRNNPWSHTTVVPFIVGNVTPVSWLYVKGVINNNKSMITWATANEQNSRHFELEHSINGRDFTSIATVIAAGNSNTQKIYNAVHTSPISGVNFYRIKQVDIDGSFRYSATISLLMQGSGVMQVSPNPARNYFVLLLDGFAAPTQLNLYNSSGQRVLQQQLPAALRHTINTSNLPAGQYLLETITGGKKQSCQLLLQ